MLALDGSGDAIVSDPQLDGAQFAALLQDSRADEVLARLFSLPGRNVSRPLHAQALIASALPSALEAGIHDAELVDWYGWLSDNDRQAETSDIAGLFKQWQEHTRSMEATDAAEI